MQLIIRKLNLTNFKGIKSLEINFNDEITNIMGDNATGKTTVFDAFTWLFFGKESTDRKDFNIKNTVDRSLNRQEHEVSAIVYINGSETSIRRVYKENWVKKTGKTTSEFVGNEQEFYWDEVPMKAGEFAKKVSEVLDEKIFKLISNPLYFNSLKWQERRSVLEQLAGPTTNEEIANGNKLYTELLAKLTNGKTLKGLKDQIASKKKLIKDELDTIPTRIDEINRNMPEAVNTVSIQKKIEELNGAVATIEGEMADRSKVSEGVFLQIQEHQNKIYGIKTKISEIKFGIQQRMQDEANETNSRRAAITREIASIKSAIDQIERQNSFRETDIRILETKLAVKRKEWAMENEKTLQFDEHAFNCPTCRRAYEAVDIEDMKEKMTSNFNTAKADKISAITAEANRIKEELQRLNEASHSNEVEEARKQLDQLNADLAQFDANNSEPKTSMDDLLKLAPEYAALTADLRLLEETIPVAPKVDIANLQEKKAGIVAEIDLQKAMLSNNGVIENSKTRIKELEAREKTLAKELADYEGQEHVISSFTKAKIETIEAKINGMFKLVKFKMFDQLINGGEEETCETMLHGVPFSDLNNAARINAGLDIINALCSFYGVHAPCFIDNAESITKLINVESQIIRLVVSEQDKQLRVA